MNKKLNLALYKSIVDLDFFLLNSNLNLNSRQLTNNLSIKKAEKINSLDTFELLKSLKQFIRLLQFLKTQNLYVLHIQIENKQHYNLLKQFFQEYNANLNIRIETSFLKRHNINRNSTEMLLLLGEHVSISNNGTIKRLFSQNISLFNKLNAANEFNNCGVYKIFNDAFDFKKIVFMIILINQVFTNTKLN